MIPFIEKLPSTEKTTTCNKNHRNLLKNTSQHQSIIHMQEIDENYANVNAYPTHIDTETLMPVDQKRNATAKMRPLCKRAVTDTT